MLFKNDISDLLRFGLVTLFIVVFFGVSLFLVVRLVQLEIVASRADLSTIYNAVISGAVKSGGTAVSDSASAAKEPLKMVFAGDVMLARGVAYMVDKYGDGDYAFPFLNIAGELKTGDVVFGNLEGPVSDKGYKAGSIYSFEADPAAIGGLEYAGFNVMSCANNHMLDYTREALEDTLARLQDAKILCVGAGMNAAEAYEPKFLDIKGNRIAFLGYADFPVDSWYATETRSGLAQATEDNLKNGIDAAKKQGADIIIVSFHFGNEYETEPSETQKKLAHLAIDSGANLVVGHHPHVVQPVEKITPQADDGEATAPQATASGGTLGDQFETKNLFNFNISKPAAGTNAADAEASGWIAYSLGNFVFDQNFSEATMEGELLEASTENGSITDVISKKVKINSHYQPEIVK